MLARAIGWQHVYSRLSCSCSGDDSCTLAYSWSELASGKGDFSDGTVQSWTAEGNPSCGGRCPVVAVHVAQRFSSPL